MNVVSTTFIHDDFITMLREHKINRITLLIKDSTQMAMSPLHVDF